MDYFNGLCTREHRKTMGEHEINGGNKTLLGLDCADDLNVFDIVNGMMNALRTQE